jgi:hypothetical protein
MRSKRPWLLYLLISSQARKRAGSLGFCAPLAGRASHPESAARRVSFSELLGSLGQL